MSNDESLAKTLDERRADRMEEPEPFITIHELRAAMKLDFNQHIINSMTPDRGYPFPVDNVLELIEKNWPRN
jgi:hypothetical protein